VSLDFLEVSAGSSDLAGVDGPVARSPMEPRARAAGGRFEIRDGWNLATGFSRDPEALARTAVGWADVSHMRKLELQGPETALQAAAAAAGVDELVLGRAARASEAWWCPLTRERVLVIGAADGLRSGLPDEVSVLEVTTVYAAMTLVGPLARETFARFCALDLRPQSTPVGGLRPGSIARQPGLVVREGEDRYLFLFGWAVGEYMWTVVEDAARHLGGGPLGLDALSRHAETARA
jgi:glycine cleavage system aminomethyltransferase T